MNIPNGFDSFTEYEKTEYEHVISKEIHPVDGALNMGEVVRAVSELRIMRPYW